MTPVSAIPRRWQSWLSRWQQRWVPHLLAWAGPAVAPDALGTELALRQAAQQAWLGAQQAAWVPLPPQAQFQQRHIRYWLADRVDAAALPRAHWSRWAQVVGPLPPPGQPYLALTAHYGAGLWAHAIFGQHHRRSRFLYQPLTPQAPPAEQTLARQRLTALAHVMGHPPLPTGGASQAMLRWWTQGGGIMALFDAPAAGRRAIELPLRPGLALQVPRGLFVLAAQSQVPVYVYFCRLDNSGRRLVHVHPPLCSRSPQRLAQHVGHLLWQALHHDPAAWHFWAGLAALQPTPPEV